jgi:hypothetical protein
MRLVVLTRKLYLVINKLSRVSYHLMHEESRRSLAQASIRRTNGGTPLLGSGGPGERFTYLIHFREVVSECLQYATLALGFLFQLVQVLGEQIALGGEDADQIRVGPLSMLGLVFVAACCRCQFR